MLPLSIFFGYAIMDQFLKGANNMDEHFFRSDLRSNLPVILGFFIVFLLLFYYLCIFLFFIFYTVCVFFFLFLLIVIYFFLVFYLFIYLFFFIITIYICSLQ
jgi:hypothetical protein